MLHVKQLNVASCIRPEMKPLTFHLAVLSTLELSCYQFNSLAALFLESASYSAPSHSWFWMIYFNLLFEILFPIFVLISPGVVIIDACCLTIFIVILTILSYCLTDLTI